MTTRKDDALAAFDAMTKHEWDWFRLAQRRPRLGREEFRALVAAGRVDSSLVLQNAAVAHDLEEADRRISDNLDRQIEMTVRPARSMPKLKAVAS